MKRDEFIITIKAIGSHGWETLAKCTPSTYEYVFTSICHTHSDWKIKVLNIHNEVIAAHNVPVEEW